ncbi:hypothetical protein J437_LFUL012272 [Ladona fulva]|uniref:glutathione-specific gamma-glutamylcyclotransferase n=1 Tax=Ladona fulva TaxID=123851 RepID=A0A8K0K7T1_LADFU|nr:hypothetical protein J437_LFUL012272 [Ladona fulva]
MKCGFLVTDPLFGKLIFRMRRNCLVSLLATYEGSGSRVKIIGEFLEELSFPGRVVTLVPTEDPEAKVWGVAYKINDELAPTVASHLDFREKDGYEKKTVTFYPMPGPANEDTSLNVNDLKPFTLSVYIATRNNKFYAGEADINEIARQIYGAVGPSGTNKEYLLKLAEATRSLYPQCIDHHLFELERKVLDLEKMRK